MNTNHIALSTKLRQTPSKNRVASLHSEIVMAWDVIALRVLFGLAGLFLSVDFCQSQTPKNDDPNHSNVRSSENRRAPDGFLTVAMMQATPAGSDLEKNFQIAESYCRQAAAKGADILLMPEMWSIGYQGLTQMDPKSVEQWQAQAIRTDGAWVSRFRKLAKELDMAIAVTYLQDWSPAPRNSLTLINRRGEIVMTYAKVHTCDFGFEVALTPGKHWQVVDLDTAEGPVKIGAMICFDREFPESARSLMLLGAEVVLTPNACLLDPLRQSQFQVRAFENAMSMVMANYPAPHHNGRSVAFAASGEKLAEAETQEQLLIVNIDLESDRRLRRNTLWGHAWRRPHRYKLLTDDRKLDVFKRQDAMGETFDANSR